MSFCVKNWNWGLEKKERKKERKKDKHRWKGKQLVYDVIERKETEKNQKVEREMKRIKNRQQWMNK